MGTRNLIAVFLDGEYRIAQYGQWDGYPSGQGVGVLDFIKSKENLSKLKESLSKVRFIDKEKDAIFLAEYDKNTPEWPNKPDNRTTEQKKWFDTYISRNLGSDILHNIAYSEDGEIIIRDSLSFASDSLFCEFGYVVDFDKNTFEIYEGYNKADVKPGDRFFGFDKEKSDGYGPIQFRKSYNLDNLPEEEVFLKDLKPDDEED